MSARRAATSPRALAALVAVVALVAPVGLLTGAAATSAAVRGPDAAGSTTAAQPGSVLGRLARDGRRLDDDWSDHDVVERLLLTVLEETPGSALRRLGVADRRLTAVLPTDAGMRSAARGHGYAAETEQDVVTALLELDGTAVDPAAAREATYLYLVVPGRRLRVADLRAVARERGRLVTLLDDGGPATLRPRLVGGVLRLVDNDWPPRGAPRLVRGSTDLLAGRRQVLQGVDRLPLAYEP